MHDALAFFRELELTDTERLIAERVIREIRERLTFLDDVGVGYLTLDRAARTLSGGEAQRIRLATQIGASLVGVLYILDEPSIGLHQRDNARLIATLERLRDIGNTVIVVEHDEETMRSADWLVDMGPGAGVHGGRVVAEGTAGGGRARPRLADGAVPQRPARDPGAGAARRRDALAQVSGVTANNLQDIDVEIPIGRFVSVTGVSGSGKSTLVNDVIYRALANRLLRARLKPGAHRAIEGLEQFDKVIEIDQSPIGRTPRSNPATYTDLFSRVRELYSLTPEARTRGYTPGRFSFNVKGGRCEACAGDGMIRIEMHFLPDVYVPCEVCKGKRYNRETLDIRYKGASIADVLAMSVEEALEFFGKEPKLRRRLQTLHDVGLDYVKLGQPATTLSGGEAQRVKLAAELSKVATGRTLYILDEPTTGLHIHDVAKLLEVLQRLVDAGNTVLVIEHNLDVIKQSDWVIDLGPEGGDAGGARDRHGHAGAGGRGGGVLHRPVPARASSRRRRRPERSRSDDAELLRRNEQEASRGCRPGQDGDTRTPALIYVEVRPVSMRPTGYALARRKIPSGGARACFDQLDAIAVGIAHEADARAALADRVRRPLRLHALLVQRGQRAVEVGDADRDVAVARADLVGLGAAVVVRQLEPGLGIARVAEEVVRGLVADRRRAHVLEAEALGVEADRGGGVDDPVTGVYEGSMHGSSLRRVGGCAAP